MWKKAREIDNRYKVASTELMNDILPPLFSKGFNINKNEVTYTKGEDNGVIGMELCIYLPNEIDEYSKTKRIRQYLPHNSQKIVAIENTATRGDCKHRGLHKYTLSIYFNRILSPPTMEYITEITTAIQNIMTDD